MGRRRAINGTLLAGTIMLAFQAAGGQGHRDDPGALCGRWEVCAL